MSDPIIEARSVNMIFSTRKGELTVLEDFNLAVHPGEVLCIVGASGCGKSTFLNFDKQVVITIMMTDKVIMLLQVVVTACLFAMDSPALAQGFDRGQALYENHCQDCHTPWAHTRDNRKVTTLKGLRTRVAAWSIHAGLDWGREEIDEVTDYLNIHFYQLTE